jgi:hypothetical protein
LEVVLAFLGAEEMADFANCAPQGVNCSDGAGAQERFEFRKSHFDRVEVGTLGGLPAKAQTIDAHTTVSVGRYPRDFPISSAFRRKATEHVAEIKR